jgi:hypothetical protein
VSVPAETGYQSKNFCGRWTGLPDAARSCEKILAQPGQVRSPALAGETSQGFESPYLHSLVHK